MAELNPDQQFDPEVMGGSIKRRIVNPALLEERQKCNFDQDEAKKVIYPPDQLAEFKVWEDLVKKHP